MNKCDICEVEWDPRSQQHVRGRDCAAAIKVRLDQTYLMAKKLEYMFNEWVAKEKEKDDGVTNAFSEMAGRLAALNERVDNLAKRVNLIQHPKLANVRSMPKPGSAD